MKSYDDIKTALLAAASAMAVFKGVNVLRNAVKGWKAAAQTVQEYTIATTAAAGAETAQTAALTLKQTVVGVLTGKISLLAAAQAAICSREGK